VANRSFSHHAAGGARDFDAGSAGVYEEAQLGGPEVPDVGRNDRLGTAGAG